MESALSLPDAFFELLLASKGVLKDSYIPPAGWCRGSWHLANGARERLEGAVKGLEEAVKAAL